MLAVNQLIGFAATQQSLVETIIADGTGTNGGDYTSYGGLAAARDGTTSQTAANSAGVSPATTAEKLYTVDWGSGKVPRRVVIYGPSDDGLQSFVGYTSDFRLLCSDTGAFSGEEVEVWATTGVADGTSTVVDSNSVGSGVITATMTAYRYWALAQTPSASAELYIAEIKFYEGV